jgi:integrase
VPNALRKQIKSRQIKKSLKTDDLSKAKRLAEILHAYVILLFKKMEDGMLSESQAQNLLDEYIRIMLEKHEEGLCRKALPDANWSSKQAIIMKQNYLDAISSLKNSLMENDLSIACEFMSWLKAEKGIEPENKMEEIKLKRGFLQKSIQAFKICMERVEGNYDNSFDSIPIRNIQYIGPTQSQPTTHSAIQSASQGHPIGPLLDEFLNEQITTEAWLETTCVDKKAHLNLCKEWLGEDKNIEEISRDDMLNYFENVVKRLPQNRKKNKKCQGLSLREQLALNLPNIGKKTANDYMTTLSMFFDWCFGQKRLQIGNPASKIRYSRIRQQTKTRLPYNKSEVLKILKELSNLPQRGINKEINIDRLWITLIGMFQGSRMSEICQLNIDDIVRVKDIPCINITIEEAEGQKLKNEKSIRTLPIHPSLLELGFLNFVDERRRARDIILKSSKAKRKEKDKSKLLFCTMTQSESNKKYTRNFANFFNKLNRDKITNNQRKSFHSFRHGFSTLLKDSGVDTTYITYLDGHTPKTETERTYIHSNMENLYAELKKLDYGIDIFSIFGKAPLTEEEISEQIRELPEDDSIFSYT